MEAKHKGNDGPDGQLDSLIWLDCKLLVSYCKLLEIGQKLVQ